VFNPGTGLKKVANTLQVRFNKRRQLVRGSQERCTHAHGASVPRVQAGLKMLQSCKSEFVSLGGGAAHESEAHAGEEPVLARGCT